MPVLPSSMRSTTGEKEIFRRLQAGSIFKFSLHIRWRVRGFWPVIYILNRRPSPLLLPEGVFSCKGYIGIDIA